MGAFQDLLYVIYIKFREPTGNRYGSSFDKAENYFLEENKLKCWDIL